MSNRSQVMGDYFFTVLSVLAIALSLGGYFGRLNLYLEFASGYKIQLLLLGLCSLFYFCLTRQKIGIIISLFCVVLNLAEILPWYWNQPRITNIESYEPLKVLSYNVLWSNKQYNKAIALINREQPDIAVFLEAQKPWSRALTPLKADFPYHIGVEKLEIEIYSKLPLNNTEVELYGTYRGLVLSDIAIGNSNLKFVATHAYPQLYFGRKGWEIRNEHLEIGIGEYIAKSKQPVVIIGDLNVSMWSPFYRSLIDKSGLDNARQGFGVLPTHSIISPQFAALSAPIDHCLVTPNIQVQDFKLGKDIGSDHLPIIANLLIPSNNS